MKGGHVSASPGAERRRARSAILLRAGLRLAPQVDSEEELAGKLADIEALSGEEPVSATYVKHAAKRAWRMQAGNRNWVQGNGVVQVSAEELKLVGSADAFWLLCHLRIAHGSRPEPFAIAVRAMAERESITGMGETALRRAREHLIKRGFLRRVHAGGKGPGDPAKFVLTAPPRPVSPPAGG